jgi:hypothetical protein
MKGSRGPNYRRRKEVRKGEGRCGKEKGEEGKGGVEERGKNRLLPLTEERRRRGGET